MNAKEAIKILTALADGVDPYTGEVLSNDGTYQNPDTVRALFLALKGLELLESREQRVKSLPNNAGKPWSKEEESQLANDFDSGLSNEELSKKYNRTRGAIQSRLVKIGKIKP